MLIPDKYKISAQKLTPKVDPGQLGFQDTSELPPLDEPIGQQRALDALQFGLNMKSPGFNIYASGPVGTGKWSIVRQMVGQSAQGGPVPPDWCYVHNFQDPSRPRCLAFPAGQGRAFKSAMATLIQDLRRELPTQFESTKYLDAKAKIVDDVEAKKKALFKEVKAVASERAFGFQEAAVGFSLVPLKEGQHMAEEDLKRLSSQERGELGERRREIEGKIREFQSHVHALDHEAERAIRQMDRQMVKNLLERRIEEMKRAYSDLPDVLRYVDAVDEDIVTNYRDFLHKESTGLPFLATSASTSQHDLARYQVNLIVEHPADHGSPIVDESHPTYANLVGKIERKAHMGVVYTDFTEIRAGACVQASGGYLILNALDLLRQPFAWDALKRVVKTREVKIEDPGEFFGFSTTGLKPHPIPVELKIILLGPPVLYHLLQAYEEDFAKLFKVKADFDVDMTRSDEVDRRYAGFVAHLCREEHLPHFDAGAVSEIIQQSLRLADRYDKLSLRLSLLSDLVREAAFWAQRAGRRLVSREDVQQAIAKKRFRANLPEQWLQEEIREGTLLVDVDGEVVGQVNGLSVHLLGDSTFGRPCRITARTFVGTKGVIDIQRQAELAGEIHSKGVMTLAGYLAGTFAGNHPFALSGTLTFEQTYSEVEGDSAAVAELAVIISSLADAPILQSLAITGSVNQLGEIQPIGGVNEKIEGFFETCKRHGLTGSQGVIVPNRNAKHLALRHEVVEAVEAGMFAVYGIDKIEEALELLMGMPAGERGVDGAYSPDTLYGRVAQRVEEMARIVSQWGEKEEQND